MADPQSIIAAAAAATTATEDAIGRIERALRAPRFVNGFGVYSDRSTVVANLGAARFAVEAAITAIRSCPWPSAADYDAAG
jgi:hypothetical protein